MLHARWKQETLPIDCGMQTACVAVEHVWLNICRIIHNVWMDGLDGWFERMI